MSCRNQTILRPAALPLPMGHFKGYAQFFDWEVQKKKNSHSSLDLSTFPLFLPLLLNSFGNPLAVEQYFAINILIFYGEVWIPQIFSWLLRTAATRAAPRPEPSVDSIRSNLYSTWLTNNAAITSKVGRYKANTYKIKSSRLTPISWLILLRMMFGKCGWYRNTWGFAMKT